MVNYHYFAIRTQRVRNIRYPRERAIGRRSIVHYFVREGYTVSGVVYVYELKARSGLCPGYRESIRHFDRVVIRRKVRYRYTSSYYRPVGGSVHVLRVSGVHNFEIYPPHCIGNGVPYIRLIPGVALYYASFNREARCKSGRVAYVVTYLDERHRSVQRPGYGVVLSYLLGPYYEHLILRGLCRIERYSAPYVEYVAYVLDRSRKIVMVPYPQFGLRIGYVSYFVGNSKLIEILGGTVITLLRGKPYPRGVGPVPDIYVHKLYGAGVIPGYTSIVVVNVPDLGRGVYLKSSLDGKNSACVLNRSRNIVVVLHPYLNALAYRHRSFYAVYDVPFVGLGCPMRTGRAHGYLKVRHKVIGRPAYQDLVAREVTVRRPLYVLGNSYSKGFPSGSRRIVKRNFSLYLEIFGNIVGYELKTLVISFYVTSCSYYAHGIARYTPVVICSDRRVDRLGSYGVPCNVIRGVLQHHKINLTELCPVDITELRSVSSVYPFNRVTRDR